MTGSATFKINEEAGRFELFSGGGISQLTYELSGNVISLNHVEVPSGLEGAGLGSLLLEKTMAYIRENDLTFIPHCPFVKAYLKLHSEYNDLLAK
jgi:uncharacterized protein